MTYSSCASYCVCFSLQVASNGYSPSMTSSARDCDDINCRYVSGLRTNNTSPDMQNNRPSLPHIVGYYELESTKSFSKDLKPRGAAGGSGTNGNGCATGSTNPSIDHLRSAIVRLTQTRTENWTSSSSSTMNLIPLSWARFVRHLESIVEREPMLTCLPLPEVVAIARSFDMSPSEAYRALVYFERRGQLFVGGGIGLGECGSDEVESKSGNTDVNHEDLHVMTKVVVISISWLFKTIARVIDFLDSSIVREREITAVLASDSPIGRDLDRQLVRAGLTSSPARSLWLLGTLKAFDLCVPVGQGGGSLGLSLLSSTSSQAYLFPSLLETGSPTESVWSENPNCHEKQVTCEATVRRLRPGMFSGLQRQLASADGIRQMAVVANPPLVLLSHHIVFTTSLDGGSCAECFHIRRRCRPENHRIRQHFTHPAVRDESVTILPPPAGYADDNTITAVDDGGCGCCSITSSTNIIHRVHMELGSNLDFVRIQVRGVSPCCVMRSVIDFIDLHLDDFRPSTQHPDVLPPPYSSLNIDAVSCVSSMVAQADLRPHAATTNGCSPKLRPSPNEQDSSGISSHVLPSFYSRLTSRCTSKGSIRYTGPSGGGGASPSDVGDLDDDDDECGSGDQLQSDDDREDGIDARRRLFVVCPKCILLRTVNPERIEYPKQGSRLLSTSSSSSYPGGTRRRKPICRKWHNLGSWARVVTGDYRPTLRGMDGGVNVLANVLPLIAPPSMPTPGLLLNGAALPDHEHPRLVLILPPSERLSNVDWYVFSRPRFIDGFDVHFLCEYTGYWHFVNDGGVEFRLGGNGSSTTAATSTSQSVPTTVYRGRRPGCLGVEHQLPVSLLRLAIPMIQCLRGVGEHAVNARMLAPVMGELLNAYDGNGSTSSAGYNHRGDPSAWLVKHRDKLASMLTKVSLTARFIGIFYIAFFSRSSFNQHVFYVLFLGTI